MRKKRVWRYYCGFCKKAGCLAGYMQRHEEGCTANPNRVCRMCDMVDATQKPLADLVAVFDGYDVEADDYPTGPDNGADMAKRIKELEDLAEGCPACMLAAARVVSVKHPEWWTNVEYKERRDSVMADIKDAGEEQRMGPDAVFSYAGRLLK